MRYPSFLPRFSELPTLFPGLLLAIFVALIATLIALIIPKIGAAPIAIFLGILLGNLYFKDPICRRSLIRILHRFFRIIDHL